jgi:hypothetical protein
MSDDPILELMLFKTFVSDGHSIFPMDTIEWKGMLWLVPEWIECKSEKWKRPARLICMAKLEVRDLRNTPQPADFAVVVPIPKSVFEGHDQGPEPVEYLVVEHPAVRYRIPLIH